ncbi:MAG: hypothetical protein IJ093_02505 [Bacilli bacterium]|nr:hypothetical protein [Bacilli bacterium]
MRVRFKYFFFMLVAILFVSNVDVVKAANYAAAPDQFTYKYLSDGSFCFDKYTGDITARKSGYACSPKGSEIAKYATFGGQDNAIYCSEWKKSIDSGATFKRYSTSKWNPKSERAIVAGAISYNLNKNNVLDRTIYGKVGVTLNQYLSTYTTSPLDGSYKFTNLKSEYTNVINNSIKYYQDVKSEIAVTSLKAPKFSTKSPQLSGSQNTYRSGTITVSDLATIQYNSKVTYKLNITTNNSNAKVSTNGKDYAASISRDITSQIANGKYNFILYVQGANIADTRVTMNVSASGSKSYYTSYLYYSTRSESSTQRLLYPGIINVNRSSKASINAVVPDMNQYALYVNKVNEDGDVLKDASFKITYNGKNVNLTSKNGTYYWKSELTTSTYDFSKFTLTEVTSPAGYIYEGDKITFDNVTSGTTCLNENNDEESDVNLCHPEKYSYMCVDETGTKIDPDSNGNCVDPDASDQSQSEEPTGDDDEDGDEPEIPDPVVHTYTKVCRTVNTTTAVDEKYCNSAGKYTLFVLSDKTLTVTVTNKRNSVTVSKQAITGDEEVPGAELKICTLSNYNSKKEDCDPAKNVDDNELVWVSTTTPQTIVGLVPGDYVIVENIAPIGYTKLSQGTQFSIDAAGKVTGKTVTTVPLENGESDMVIVKNDLNKLTISKTDVASTKELPGAKLSICRAKSSDAKDEVLDKSEYTNKKMVIDKNTGECIPVVLSDGTRAEWISTDQPKQIAGLPAGTYYLVEKQAPAGYGIAESIKFVMKSDGTLTDEKGNSLANNKLVMHDNIVNVPSTFANIPLSVLIIGLLLMWISFSAIFYMTKAKEEIV